MTKSQKRELTMIIIGAVLLAAAVAVTHIFSQIPRWSKLLIFAVPYIVLGLNVILDAVHGLAGKQFLDEKFLMSVASVGALAVGEYAEAVLVMLLYRLGELLQSIAVGKSRRSIADLMDICPESAELETVDGIKQVSPDEVHVGDIFVVRAGERVPLDGIVVEGSSSLNTAALTGESAPRDVAAGESITSGCINIQGTLRVRAEREYEDSTVARMLELIEGATANKSKSENFITKFARWYTPSVVGLVILLAIIPPLFFNGSWSEWIYRALTFLVISCPCALVISVPLTFFGGIGGAGKRGILVKGSNYMETLARCGTVLFDKTGTLTHGRFSIKAIYAEPDASEETLLTYTAAAESFSTHPLAACIMSAAEEMKLPKAAEVEEIAGHGVKAVVDGRTVCAGNLKLMHKIGAKPVERDASGTVIYTAVDGKYMGCIEIADTPKEGAKKAVEELNNDLGIRTVMLTGDRKAAAKNIADTLGIAEFHAELLPQNKVEIVEQELAKENGKRSVAFVGDGINDAPVIARADVGLAMGGLGSDAAIEAADIVIMDDRIEKVPLAVRIARRTVRIAWQNIIFALAVKLATLLLGALGYAEMWMALVADVGVCLIAILNAMRAMHPGK